MHKAFLSRVRCDIVCFCCSFVVRVFIGVFHRYFCVVHLLLAVVAAAAQHSRAPSSSSYPTHASSSSNTFTSDNALHTHTHTHRRKTLKKESGLLPPQCPSCYTRKSSSSGVYKYTHGMHTRRVCTPQSHLDRDVCVTESG